jgi:predicted NACHT family NTPase
MAIEWLAISAAVIPHIRKYAADRAAKLAGQYADGVLAKIYRRVVPDEKLVKANEAFVTRFSKELDSSMDLPTLHGAPYQEALQLLLGNPSVQDALQSPLDGESELDWELLRGIWNELRTPDGQRLIEVPAEFDWVKVAKTYRQSIQRQMLADSELRPVIQAIASLRTAAAVERVAGPARAFDLTRYAEALKTAFGYLKLGSLDTDWAQYEGRVRLESVYTPQSVKQALPPRDLTRDYLRLLHEERRERGLDADEELLQRRKEEYAQLSSRPLLDVVDDPAHERLVLLGDPGLGKSTLLRRLALRWAENPSGPLTLILELRRASRASGHASFLDCLEKGADQTAVLPRVELDTHLKSGESLVLFDGLDEVPEAGRADAVSDIIRFADDYRKARIIVTTRIHGYHPGSTHPERFRDARFEQFTLQDFEDAEIDRFIRFWHGEAFRDPAERARYEARMRQAIADSPAIRELAANPLLLTMMAILSRVQDLPRDRGELYERCAELLLKNWDLEKFPELKEKEEARDIKDKLGPDQKMRILEQVAAAMQQERTGLAGNLIAEDKLKQIVEQELAHLGVAQSWAVADDLIWMLQERNFMLGHLGDRQYAFIHRTFLEYFCARDLKHRLERTSSLAVDGLRELFRERWRLDEWHEVLRLLCGLIGAEYAAQCASELLAQQEQPEGHRAVFLAAQCLQEIRELGWIREARSQTRQKLLLLIRFDLPQLYEPWQPEAEEVSRIRSRAMQELARGWKDDPETLPWLKDRVARDEDQNVRRAAVQEFARGWKEDPETLPLLKDLAARDENRAVRQAAVQELARRWKDDPETLPWLKDRAAHDAHGAVREAAVHELARRWMGDPEVQKLVRGLR